MALHGTPAAATHSVCRHRPRCRSRPIRAARKIPRLVCPGPSSARRCGPIRPQPVEGNCSSPVPSPRPSKPGNTNRANMLRLARSAMEKATISSALSAIPPPGNWRGTRQEHWLRDAACVQLLARQEVLMRRCARAICRAYPQLFAADEEIREMGIWSHYVTVPTRNVEAGSLTPAASRLSRNETENVDFDTFYRSRPVMPSSPRRESCTPVPLGVSPRYPPVNTPSLPTPSAAGRSASGIGARSTKAGEGIGVGARPNRVVAAVMVGITAPRRRVSGINASAAGPSTAPTSSRAVHTSARPAPSC